MKQILRIFLFAPLLIGGVWLSNADVVYQRPRPGYAWLVRVDSTGKKCWEKVYGFPQESGFWSVAETIEGGFALLGFIRSDLDSINAKDTLIYKENRRPWLYVTDSLGNRKWDKVFPFEKLKAAFGKSLFQLPDNGFILSGFTFEHKPPFDDTWIIRTDLNGKEVWRKLVKGFYLSSFVPANDHEVLLIGRYDFDKDKNNLGSLKNPRQHGRVALITLEGDIKWNREYGGDDNLDVLYDGCSLKNNEYFIIGMSSHVGDDFTEYSWILRLDSQGSIEWERKDSLITNMSINHLVKKNEYYYLLPDQGLYSKIIKIDKLGTELNKWALTDIHPNDFASTPDNGFIIAGRNQKESGEWDAVLIKVDSSGNTQWRNTYGGDFSEEVHQVISLKHGGYLPCRFYVFG